MFIVLGSAAIALGAVLFLGRRFFAALNEFSDAVVKSVLLGRPAPRGDLTPWTYTPAAMGVGLSLLGVGLLAYGIVRAAT